MPEGAAGFSQRSPFPLIISSQNLEYKRISEGYFLEIFISPGNAHVAGIHIGLQKKHIVVGLHSSEFGYIFGWFPIRNSWVIKTGSHKHIGVSFLFNVIIR